MIQIQFNNATQVSLEKVGNPEQISYTLEDNVFTCSDNFFSENDKNYYKFAITGSDVTVSGVIDSITQPYQYYNLFLSCTQIVDASELQLTAPTLTDFCYSNFFKDCVNLTAAPFALPALSASSWCYQGMFAGCTSLSTAPIISATTLAPYCYYAMFYNCKALTGGPKLDYSGQALPKWCWNSMFFGCENLSSCPSYSFLSAGVGSVASMFLGCKKIHAKPRFGVNALSTYSAQGMFQRDDIFDFLEYRSTQWPDASLSATTDWLKDVSESGTFKTRYNLPKIYDTSHIPPTWDVWQYDAPLTFISEGDTTVKIQVNNDISSPSVPTALFYNKNKTGWQNYTFGQTISLSDKDQVGFIIRGWGYTPKVTTGGSGTIKLMGELVSIIGRGGWAISSGNAQNNLPSNRDYNFYRTFRNCTNIRDAKWLVMPTNVMPWCYWYMFENCSKLETPPELPATNIASSCYYGMFMNCSKLQYAPELKATTQASDCYGGMFAGCTSLSSMNVNFTTWGTNDNPVGQIVYNTESWVPSNGNPNGVFYKPSGLATRFGSSFIPSGWTVINK